MVDYYASARLPKAGQGRKWLNLCYTMSTVDMDLFDQLSCYKGLI